MSGRKSTIAQRIQSFVDNPITTLVKGLALLVIGLSEASRTFRDDVTHGTVRVGHGLIILGVFGILGALPHLIEGLSAGGRFLELRDRGRNSSQDFDNP
jgi:hypothetical protein